MAIFPGFLFRKCYYKGEFTKQFSQSNEFDKLLWNVFFSGLSVGITFLSVSLFKSISNLEVLDSLSYETITKIATPISVNQIPAEDIIYKTYKDLLLIIFLIYFFSCFFGLMIHWLVRTLKLDTRFPLFRFKNYWYYYIHGGNILYGKPSDKKLHFTMVDVLCEIAGKTKLYTGILSQYTISKEDNNLENIFLTEARDFKQVKDTGGNTTEVIKRSIPGSAFCIPYKTVLNMNLIYVYKDESGRDFRKLYKTIVNVLFFVTSTLVIISLWFDLSTYGISGLWRKLGYGCWSFVALTNLRLLIFAEKNQERLVRFVLVITGILWLMYYGSLVNIWVAILALSISISIAAVSQSTSTDSGTDTPTPNSNL